MNNLEKGYLAVAEGKSIYFSYVPKEELLRSHWEEAMALENMGVNRIILGMSFIPKEKFSDNTIEFVVVPAEEKTRFYAQSMKGVFDVLLQKRSLNESEAPGDI